MDTDPAPPDFNSPHCQSAEAYASGAHVQFFRHIGGMENFRRLRRMRRELAMLGVSADTFSELIREVQETSLWRINASSVTGPMADETARCYGSREAARLHIAWNASVPHNSGDVEAKQRMNSEWWRCLDPADTAWPLPPGPPRALYAPEGWGNDTVEARLQREHIDLSL